MRVPCQCVAYLLDLVTTRVILNFNLFTESRGDLIMNKQGCDCITGSRVLLGTFFVTRYCNLSVIVVINEKILEWVQNIQYYTLECFRVS